MKQATKMENQLIDYNAQDYWDKNEKYREQNWDWKIIGIIADVEIINLDRFWEHFTKLKTICIFYSPGFKSYRVRSTDNSLNYYISDDNLPSFCFTSIKEQKSQRTEFNMNETSILFKFQADTKVYTEFGNLTLDTMKLYKQSDKIIQNFHALKRVDYSSFYFDDFQIKKI
jgi:hypothetical protein